MSRQSRLVGLDRLRGAALLFMLVQHFTDWLAGDARRVLPGWRWFAVTDLAAPAFAVAAGASLQLFVATRRARGVDGAPLHTDVLRRYGLLIPLGAALGLVVFRNAWGFGVLEALGVGSLLAYIAGRRLSTAAIVPIAVVFLLADTVVGHLVAGWDRHTYAYHVLHGTFPVTTYTGFVLAGMLGAAALRGRDRPRAALITGLALAAATCFMAAAGAEPDRYPATAAFVVPALAGTCLVYAALAAWRPDRTLALVDGASQHTLGVFVTHYAVLLAARWWLPDLSNAAGVAAALALTVLFAALAPRMPTLPWSPRKGSATRTTPPRNVVEGQPASAAFLSSSSASPRPWAMSQTPGTVSRQATSPKSIDPR
jgi:uncharacterized membrane protein